MKTSTRRNIVAGIVAVAVIITAASFLDEAELFVVNFIGVSVAFVGCATFVVRYHFTTGGAWFASAVGRNVMLLMACLALALGFILSVYFFGQYPMRRPIGAALYPLIGYAAWGRVVLQFRAQSQLHAPTPDTERRRRSDDAPREETN